MENNKSECILKMQRDINEWRARYADAERMISEVREASEEALWKSRCDIAELTAVVKLLVEKYCAEGYAVIERDELANEINRVFGGAEVLDVGENLGGAFLIRAVM